MLNFKPLELNGFFSAFVCNLALSAAVNTSAGMGKLFLWAGQMKKVKVRWANLIYYKVTLLTEIIIIIIIMEKVIQYFNFP
jgi:hypothetical protein